MKLAIHQPQYMPWVGYFHKMASVDLFVFLDDVQFKKNEWQHRNRIRNPQGWQWLSVPNHYKFPQRINEVALNDTQRWREKHLRSIEMCYGKAPFFGHYAERLNEFYSRRWDTMAAVCVDSVKLLAELIGVTTPTVMSSRHSFESQATERLVAICGHFGADTYLAGAGGRDYMDLSLFEQAGIEVAFQEFSPPRYTQHWCKSDEDFVPGLSALDLVLNRGPASLDILMERT